MTCGTPALDHKACECLLLCAGATDAGPFGLANWHGALHCPPRHLPHRCRLKVVWVQAEDMSEKFAKEMKRHGFDAKPVDMEVYEVGTSDAVHPLSLCVRWMAWSC